MFQTTNQISKKVARPLPDKIVSSRMAPLDTPPQDLLMQALGLSFQVCLLIVTSVYATHL